MNGLQGKRVLVTGAAGGLGMALVKVLATQGSQVVGLVKSPQDAECLSDLPGAICSSIVADLGDPAGLEISLKAEIAKNGSFYGIVNNAAIYPKASVEVLNPAEMTAVLAINAVGAAAVVRACLPGMKAKGQGRIVNVASITFYTGMEDLSAYVASKGALIGMTHVWARELGPHGISVNAIAPGAFQTDAEKIHPNPGEYNRYVLSQQALKRRGQPEEFADLAAFLLGQGAGFITGQTIRIDGGWVTQ